MRTMQKLVCILMAVALLLSLSLAVFADATTPHTITIENPDANDDHTYTAYQVFVGKYNEATNTLSDVAWGNGVNATDLLADLQSIPAFAGCTTAAEVVQVLAQYNDNSEEVRAFAALVDKNTTTAAGSGTTDIANGDPAVINVVGDGYYYVKDTTPPEDLETDTYSDYILLVEGDVTVTAKDTTGVTSEKKVKDINDSTLEGSDWQDSADYDIGDPVPFQFTGHVASDYDLYDTYKIIFHDKESEGLTFSEVTKVCVDGVEISDAYYDVVTTGLTDECTFEVVLENLKTIVDDEGEPLVHANSVITVEYESILNQQAVIGKPGNPNEMCMEYSNNPTDETSTGKTPWDKVVVFTYKITIYKVDENNNPLDGAQFGLWKWIPNEGEEEPVEPDDYQLDEQGNLILETEHGHWEPVSGSSTGDPDAGENGEVVSINGKAILDTFVDNEGNKFFCIKDKATENGAEQLIYLKESDVRNAHAIIESGMLSSVGVDYYELKNGVMQKVQSNFGYTIKNVEIKTETNTIFFWNGIDDGHYIVIETVTPPGYNTLEPIEFDVVAEHEENSQDPQLIYVDGDPFHDLDEDGTLEATIVNHSGGELPSTGGIGTVLFYVLGGLLVLGAGAVLVVKKFSDAN